MFQKEKAKKKKKKEKTTTTTTTPLRIAFVCSIRNTATTIQTSTHVEVIIASVCSIRISVYKSNLDSSRLLRT